MQMSIWRRYWGGACCALLLGPSTTLGSMASTPTATLPLEPARTVVLRDRRGHMAFGRRRRPTASTLVFDLLGDLYRLDVRGGTASRLTQGIAFDSQPAWSPDGDDIAFLSDRSGAENVWVMRVDGSDAHQVTDNDGPNEYISPAWSRTAVPVRLPLPRRPQRHRDSGATNSRPAVAKMLSTAEASTHWAPHRRRTGATSTTRCVAVRHSRTTSTCRCGRSRGANSRPGAPRRSSTTSAAPCARCCRRDGSQLAYAVERMDRRACGCATCTAAPIGCSWCRSSMTHRKRCRLVTWCRVMRSRPMAARSC